MIIFTPASFEYNSIICQLSLFPLLLYLTCSAVVVMHYYSISDKISHHGNTMGSFIFLQLYSYLLHSNKNTFPKVLTVSKFQVTIAKSLCENVAPTGALETVLCVFLNFFGADERPSTVFQNISSLV